MRPLYILWQLPAAGQEERMRVLILVAVVALLGGCGGGPGVRGNEIGGSVIGAWPDQALPMADKHCRQYGKAARITSQYELTYHFSCN